MVVKPVRFTASSIIHNGPCSFCGFLLGVDGVNDPTITFYNATASSPGNEVFPTTPFDASALDPKGFMPGYVEIDCPDGLYVDVSALGTGEGVAYIRSL